MMSLPIMDSTPSPEQHHPPTPTASPHLNSTPREHHQPLDSTHFPGQHHPTEQHLSSPWTAPPPPSTQDNTFLVKNGQCTSYCNAFLYIHCIFPNHGVFCGKTTGQKMRNRCKYRSEQLIRKQGVETEVVTIHFQIILFSLIFRQICFYLSTR